MTKADSIYSLSDDAFGWYLTGLTDGEGSFMLYFSNGPSRNGCGSWQFDFTIGLRDDDGDNLAAIADRMKCGKMYNVARPSSSFLDVKPQRRWHVRRIADLAGVIVPQFERYPLQLKKARDFTIWKQAVPIILASSQRSKKGRKGPKLITADEQAFLTAVASELKAGREYKSTIDPALSLMPPLIRPLDLFD